MRSVTDFSKNDVPIVNLIKDKLEKELSVGVSVEQLAATIGISKYYMCHIFKNTTGISIKAYEKELRLAKAKDFLIHTDKSIADIATKTAAIFPRFLWPPKRSRPRNTESC